MAIQAILATMNNLMNKDPDRFCAIFDECTFDDDLNIDSKKKLDELNAKLDHPVIKEKGLFSVDESTEYAEKIGVDFENVFYNEYSFNYVMNMVLADDYEFIKKFREKIGMSEKIEDMPILYAYLAQAWIGDEDAPKQKLMNYIKYIVNYDKTED